MLTPDADTHKHQRQINKGQAGRHTPSQAKTGRLEVTQAGRHRRGRQRQVATGRPTYTKMPLPAHRRRLTHRDAVTDRRDADSQEHTYTLPQDTVPHTETWTGPKHTWTDMDPESERDTDRHTETDPHGDT